MQTHLRAVSDTGDKGCSLSGTGEERTPSPGVNSLLLGKTAGEWVEQRMLPVSFCSQLPSAHNNSYAIVAYLEVTF